MHRQQQQHVEIRETPLGFGVFTQTAYEAYEVIGEITGALQLAHDYETDYGIDLGHDAQLEPNPPYRFLNHSCEPNCELVLWKTRKVKGHKVSRLWVQTIRRVVPGEELTIDYAWPAEAAIPCRCRSRSCRGWIVDPAELPRLNLGS